MNGSITISNANIYQTGYYKYDFSNRVKSIIFKTIITLCRCLAVNIVGVSEIVIHIEVLPKTTNLETTSFLTAEPQPTQTQPNRANQSFYTPYNTTLFPTSSPFSLTTATSNVQLLNTNLNNTTTTKTTKDLVTKQANSEIFILSNKPKTTMSTSIRTKLSSEALPSFNSKPSSTSHNSMLNDSLESSTNNTNTQMKNSSLPLHTDYSDPQIEIFNSTIAFASRPTKTLEDFSFAFNPIYKIPKPSSSATPQIQNVSTLQTLFSSTAKTEVFQTHDESIVAKEDNPNQSMYITCSNNFCETNDKLSCCMEDGKVQCCVVSEKVQSKSIVISTNRFLTFKDKRFYFSL